MTTDHKSLKMLAIALGVAAGLSVYVATGPSGVLFKAVVKMLDREGTETRTNPKSYYILDVWNPLLSPLAWQGRALYKKRCASCHGKTTGGTTKGPPLVVYDTEHFDDDAFYTAIQHGVRQNHWNFGDMPPIPGLTNEQAWKIIVYVRETQTADQRRHRHLEQ